MTESASLGRSGSSSVDRYVQDILLDPTPPLFPTIVSVELTSRCNLRCPMCPQPGLRRDKRHMDPELFRSIVDQLAVQPIELFQPQGMGESLLHPRWFEMLSYARSRRVKPIVMVSNATMLTEANARRLVRLAPDVIVVGVDGLSAETYGKVRWPARVERTDRNVERLVRLRDQAGAERPRVIARMIRMRENAHEVRLVRERWERILGPQDRFVVSTVHTWAGAVPDHRPDDQAKPPSGPSGVCRMLLKTLTVQQDGNLTPCCYDTEGQLSVGHADEVSLAEAWQGEPLARLRRLHAEGRHDEIDLCSGCDAFVV